MPESLSDLARHLIARLERLSVDSHWAHRASGLRRSLMRYLDDIEAGKTLDKDTERHLEKLIHQGFRIVESAAREMGDQK